MIGAVTGAALWGLPVHVVVIVLAITLVASLCQAAAGFGFALLAVPLLSLVIAPQTAVVMVFLLGSLSTILTMVRHHRAIAWPEANTLSMGAVLCMPLGAFILLTASPTGLRFGLGIVTCAAALWLLVPRRHERSAPLGFRRPVAFAVGAVSGVLNTSLATNGPPLVAYLRARRLATDPFRSTIATVFTISNVVGLIILVAAGAIHGQEVRYAALALIPAVLGWLIGNRLVRRLAPHHFARMVDVLLLVSGLLALAKAAWG